VVSFSDGKLHAFDFDGNELWDYAASGGSDIFMSAATDGSKLFFGGGNAMNCVDIATHNEEWTFDVGDAVTTTPAVEAGVVYFATGKNDKKLYAVDIATGNEVWGRSLYGSLSSPAVSNGRIYIGDKDKKINCIDATDGSEVWNQTLVGACRASPVVAGGMVYTAANSAVGTVYCFDADDGTLKWSYDTGDYVMAQPSISDGILFVGSDTGYLYAFSNMAWDGEVELTPATVNVTADSSGVEYTISSTCAMYALIKAADAWGFTYSISDEWYVTYGSLYFDMINDRPAEGWDGWSYWVNYPDDPMPMVGANSYELDDGDVVSWYWSSGMDANPSNSEMLIQIDVAKLPAICLGDCYSEPDCGGDVTATDIPCWECIGILGDSWKPTTDCGCDLTCPDDACYNFCPECCDGSDNDGDGTIDCPYDEECACCCDFTEGDNDSTPCVPELPSVVLISVGLMMLAGYVRMRREN
jgi:hypothetical protein